MAKTRRPRGAGYNFLLPEPDGRTLADGVRHDRLILACDTAIKHLSRYMQRNEQLQWAEDIEAAAHLMQALFMGPEAAIAEAERSLHGDVQMVRNRFALACLKRRVRGTPGQRQEWFPGALLWAREFSERLHAANKKATCPVVRTLDSVYRFASERLQGYGRQTVPVRPGSDQRKPRWSTDACLEAENLLRLCFYGPADELEVRMGLAGERLARAVQDRFALACLANQELTAQAAGRQQDWFGDATSRAKSYLNRQRVSD